MSTAVLLIALWEVVAPFLTPATRDARRGLDRYEAGEYPQAVSRLEQARRSHPDARLDYDLGAARYKAGDFEAAGREFQVAGRAEDLPPGASAYNLGNAKFKAGDLEGALEAYRAALRADPADEDARFNYEWTKKQLAENPSGEEQEKSKPEQGDKNQDQDNQDSQDGQGDEQKPDSTGASPQEEQKQEGQQQEPQNAQAEPGKEGESAQPGAEGRMLSKEEAAQLLDAVTPEERELIAARLKASRRKKAEKDW